MTFAALTAVSTVTGPSAGPLDGIGGRAVVLVVLLAGSSLLWWLVARRRGHFDPLPPDSPRRTGLHADVDLDGRSLGELATFVQFSSDTCSTCPGVRRVLGEVSAATAGVAVIETRSEDHMDLVARLGILRTPTVLLLGPDGSIASRTSGPVSTHQARAALHDLEHVPTRSHP